MNYKDLTNLLLKVSGAVMIAYAIIEIPAYVSYYFSLQIHSFWAFIGLSLIPMLVALSVGVLFLFFPATVSNKLIRDRGLSATSDFDIETLERIAFSTLGLYLMFRVISDFFYHGASMYIAVRTGDMTMFNTGYAHPHALLVATAAEFAFAMYLLFGAAGLVRLLRRFRGQ